MAQKSRQNKLFAAEDYTVIYESYINANFQAFDFDTIRSAMVDHVRNNYPENYNDWVESAEFVSLLDVVAQFGHNLAYRLDLNARNNFISTAQRQESVYKLAEFLGYQPRRNVPAYGEMKVMSVKTNEAIVGSTGESLGGKDIMYEVSNNVNNLDDFITVINAVMENSNQYGSPKKAVVINNTLTEFYDLNNIANQIKFDVSGLVLGTSATYNIISSDYDKVTTNISEKSPNPTNSVGIYFKNDGKGIKSVGTGFFFGVKQGNLQYKDFDIAAPIDNMTLDIGTTNVNSTDIWVQNINTVGNITKEWTKVTDVNSNVIYNNLNAGQRDIFSVKTRENNQVSILFADKIFGNIPKDTIRVWFRTSVNSTYIVRPDDLPNKRIAIDYTGGDGNLYTATFGIQLKQPISNASANETLDEIREAAPKNYASQDRMITAQDYNTLLGSATGGVIKIKSINRTFSGHSRYSKFSDPTGTYSNLYLTGKDATVTKADKLISSSTAFNDTPQLIYDKHVKNILDNDEFVNLYYMGFKTAFENLKASHGYTKPLANRWTWNNPSETSTGVLTGYILNVDATPKIMRVGTVGLAANNYMKFITPGAMINFTLKDVTSGSFVVGTEYTIAATGSSVTDFTSIGAANSTVGTSFTATGVGSGNSTATPTKTIWAKVVDVFAHGLGIEGTGVNAGQPTGKRADGTGSIILDAVIPTASRINTVYPALSRKFSIKERDLMLAYLKANRSFTVRYDFENRSWLLDAAPKVFNAGTSFPKVGLNGEAAGLTRGDTVFSVTDLTPATDTNVTPNVTDPVVTLDDSWVIYFNSTGTSFDIYLRTMRINFSSNTIKLGNITNELELGTYTKKAKRDKVGLIGVSSGSITTIGSYYVYGFENTDSAIYRLTLIDGNADSRPDNPAVFSETSLIGTSDLNFEWEHIASENQVVDPSFTNVIDVFALTKEYDTEYKNYLKGTILVEPLPPTSYELGMKFTGVVEKKAISDTIVFKPVKYKPMFGNYAEQHLQAKFRIIKLYGANITDSDLKSKTVTAINDFFDSSNWDFGETFYFTELAAYVHKQLAGVLSSFVIVPQGTNSVFGDLFEYTPNSDELIIPDVDADDIDIIENITAANISKTGS